MSKLYLLDTNTLIEAKNFYYDMNVCPAFWDFIDLKHSETKVYSISNICNELTRGQSSDELYIWAKDRKETGFFLDSSDGDTQREFFNIANYVSKHNTYKQSEKDRFLNEADPWLIAKAKTMNATVVTREVLSPDNSKKVKIPNICNQFSVNYINSFEFLKKLNAEFILCKE